MVSTRGAGSATTTVTAPAANSKQRLQFADKLVGKGLSTDALLKKLKTLHTELSRMDQDEVETRSLAAVRKELIAPSIVLHKDKGVKAFAAACLADILKLYAPDAPYTQDELKDIFQFFFRQLANGLKGPTAPYFDQYFYLLDSLAKCKSVVLVCDLPNADELVDEVFRDFFTIVKHNHAKNIELAMVDILCALIDESQSVPTDVLDTIMAQFKEKNAGMEHPAYRLALEVCNSRADRLQRYVCQYFTDIIIQTSSEEELDDLRAAHDLIKQLNRAAPGLLHNIVPQLEEQLRVDTLPLRVMATQTLGGMFADKNGATLAQTHASTWTTWLNRRNDKATAVRVALLELIPDVLVAHPDLRKDLAETLDLKLEDPDDRVRVTVCKAYAKLDYEALLHTVEVGHLKRLAERAKDKKSNVRAEALATLGKLFKVALPEIENNSAAGIKHFAWIPEYMLSSMTTSTEVKEDVETAMAETILPLPPKGEDEVAWTERLLLVMRGIESDDAVRNLLALANLKPNSTLPLERFIDCCVAYNGGTVDENETIVKKNLVMCTQRVVGLFFTDRARATEDLQAFAKANEQRLYQLARKLADPSTDLKTLAKTLAEFSRRVEQSVSSAAAETMLRLARCSSLWAVNSSSVPTLLSKLKAKVGVAKNASRMSLSDAAAIDSQKHAQTLFQALCKRCPAALKVHLPEFSVALMDDKNQLLAQMALQGIAALALHDASLAPSDKRVIDRIVKSALGENPRHAKFAARILSKLKKNDKCEEVIQKMATNLPTAGPTTVHAHIVALAQFAKCAKDLFEAHSDLVIDFVLPHVLMESCPVDEDEMDTEDDWIDDTGLPELALAKLAALKMLRNRSLVQKDTESAADVTGPVLKMLFAILEHNGSIQDDANDSGKVRTRMRFQAAVCLLQLAQVPAYAQQIVPNFNTLALTVQDPCYNVRIAFLQRYTALAITLETRFYCIPFLTAQDPERETREYARNFIALQYKRMPAEQRHLKLELLLVRYLHLLARHPDFTSHDPEILKDMCRYVEFYVDTICNEDNLALLYHLAQKCKTVRDADSHSVSENLYYLSEIAQEILKGRAKHHGWVLDNFPGKVKLPVDMFKPLPSADVAKEIAKTSYLTDEMTEWLESHNKPVKSPAARRVLSGAGAGARAPRKRKANGAADGSPPVKRTRTSNGPSRRKQDKWSGSDNGEDDDDESIQGSDDSLVVEAPVISRGSRSRPANGPKTAVKSPAKPKSPAKKPTDTDNDSDVMDEEEEESPPASAKKARAKAPPARASRGRGKKEVEESEASNDHAMEEEESEQEEEPVAKPTRARNAKAKAEPRTKATPAKTTPAKRGKK